MSEARERLVKMLEPTIAALGYELVDLEYRAGRGQGLLRLFIDQDSGITLDDCEQVSRQVSALLDVEDPIPGDYNLEVSSPGLDRKLVRPADFERFAGHQVRVKLLHLVEGRRRLTGELLRRDGEQVVFAVDGEIVAVAMAVIDTARLVPDVAADLARSGSTKTG